MMTVQWLQPASQPGQAGLVLLSINLYAKPFFLDLCPEPVRGPGAGDPLKKWTSQTWKSNPKANQQLNLIVVKANASVGFQWLQFSHLVSSADATTAQGIDIITAVVHEATDQSVVAEDDTGHLGDVLLALVVTDVAAVIHQARHQVALPQFLSRTFFNLQHFEGLC